MGDKVAAATAEAGTLLAKAEPARDPMTNRQGANDLHGDVRVSDPNPYRQVAIREAAQFGMVGLVSTGSSSAPAAPSGRRSSLGGDASDDSRRLWNESIDDASSGGLALSGVGEGGGGLGGGIGFDAIGTLGDGSNKGAPEVVAHAQMDLGREDGVVRAPRALTEAPRANENPRGSVAARFVMDRTGNLAVGSESAADIYPGAGSRVAAREVLAVSDPPRGDSAGGASWKPGYAHRASRLAGALGLRWLSDGDL